MLKCDFFFYQERKDEAEDDNEWAVEDVEQEKNLHLWLEKKYNFDIFDVLRFYLRAIHLDLL